MMTAHAAPRISPVSALNESFALPSGLLSTHAADLDCLDRIQHLLFDQRRQELRRVQITSERGTVTLRGQVSSFYLRQLCIRCCQQVVGVFQIDDQLQVGAV